MSRWANSLAFLALIALLGCSGGAPADPTPAPDATEPAEPAEPAPAARGPRFSKAPSDVPVAEHMAAQVEEATAAGEDILLYVGAHWCEPCQAFHDAVEAGELDEALPNLRLIEYDLDLDADRLKKADYSSRYIPLFTIPGADGYSSGRQVEGGIKGDGAVDNILERLVPLIEMGRTFRNNGG